MEFLGSIEETDARSLASCRRASKRLSYILCHVFWRPKEHGEAARGHTPPAPRQQDSDHLKLPRTVYSPLRFFEPPLAAYDNPNGG